MVNSDLSKHQEQLRGMERMGDLIYSYGVKHFGAVATKQVQEEARNAGTG